MTSYCYSSYSSEILRGLKDPAVIDAAILPLLNLAHKYLIDALRAEMILLLSLQIPVSRADFGLARCKLSLPDLLRIMFVAQATDALTLLPALYFFICEYPITQIVKEASTLKDGVVEGAFIVQCGKGMDRLYQAFVEDTHSFLMPKFADRPNNRCAKRGNDYCGETMSTSYADQLRDLVLHNEMSKWLLLEFNDWDDLKYCEPCLVEAKRFHLEGRKKLWDGLPGFFGLSIWEELRTRTVCG